MDSDFLSIELTFIYHHAAYGHHGWNLQCWPWNGGIPGWTNGCNHMWTKSEFTIWINLTSSSTHTCLRLQLVVWIQCLWKNLAASTPLVPTCRSLPSMFTPVMVNSGNSTTWGCRFGLIKWCAYMLHSVFSSEMANNSFRLQIPPGYQLILLPQAPTFLSPNSCASQPIHCNLKSWQQQPLVKQWLLCCHHLVLQHIHCQHEYVIHLGFTSLVWLRDRPFQSFVGNKIANWFRSNTLNIQVQGFKSN